MGSKKSPEMLKLVIFFKENSVGLCNPSPRLV